MIKRCRQCQKEFEQIRNNQTHCSAFCRKEKNKLNRMVISIPADIVNSDSDDEEIARKLCEWIKVEFLRLKSKQAKLSASQLQFKERVKRLK